MTGKPMRMHMEHYLDSEKRCREDWVSLHLRLRAEVVAWNKDFPLDRFASYGPMPFEIERLRSTRRARHDTAGDSCTR